jgi:threonine dehydrogenase-like Zn-dependent dehydrogenase
MKRPRFDANRIILNELVVTGSVEYTRDDYHEAISILTDGHLPVEQLIEPDDVPLAGMQAAMELLMTGELPGKVLVAPGA